LIGDALGVDVVAVSDRTLLDPVDRMLADRIGASGRVLTCFPRPGRRPGLHSADPGLAEDALADHIREGHERWLATAQAAEKQVRDLAAQPAVTIAGADGRPLAYTAFGSVGPPLVVINALGQNTAFWHRLISCLVPRRVLVWPARGVYSGDDGGHTTLEDHVTDAEAVLDHEGVASCHVLAWCTGPRIAVELCRRRPATVRSLVFLNGSFKQLGRDKERDTAYERNLEFLCRTLNRDPRLAGRLLGIFDAEPEHDAAAETDLRTMGVRTLRQVSTLLREEVRRPFTDASTLVRYAEQLLDVWSRDPLAHATEIRVPVLFVGAEYDEVVSQERLAAAAAVFPTARHTTIRGGTHYALHDRAEEVSVLINDFLRRR
jgi:pimeloyl-ACP methyl ester carboxylesterase